MEYSDFILGIKRFSVDDVDMCVGILGIDPKKVQENVLITPGWNPERMSSLGNAELISSGALFGSFKVWDVDNGNFGITYIQTGCGAPLVMDALLGLGDTNCKRIIFVSSVGAIDAKMSIGDVFVPEYSISGDGASRYIASNNLDKDIFGEKAYPDERLFNKLKIETERVCKDSGVNWHIGRAFCTDTIVGQFVHIDNILKTGCNAVDMETAVAFRTARLIKKPIVALLNVLDNAAVNKSLFCKNTSEEIEYRRYVRSDVMPKIIHNFITANKSNG